MLGDHKVEKRSEGLQREVVRYLAIIAIVSNGVLSLLLWKTLPELHPEGGAKIVLTIGFYIIAFASVLVWSSYRLIRHIVINPLQSIERAATAVSAGETEHRVGVDQNNEIGRLGMAIESMRVRLVGDQEKLADYARSLERLNDELEEAQRALIRGEKLASVGRLAAGVAHEIGNPLGAVSGYLSLLKSSVHDKEATELLERTDLEVNRMGRILRQLLDYSRPHSAPEFASDVNDILRSTVEGIRAQGIDPSTVLDVDLAGDLPPIWIASDPLRQIFWNLALNAVQSLDKGGRVLLKSERLLNRQLREEPIGFLFRSRMRRGDRPRPEVMNQRRSRRAGDSESTEVDAKRSRGGKLPAFLFQEEGEALRVSIEDSGPGISNEDLGKIFDPFFTTKPVGKGSGLGLFVSLNLVESLGGFLDVQSEVGKGSTFIVLFPISPAR